MLNNSITSKLYISFIFFAIFVNILFFVVVNYETKFAAKQIGLNNIPERILTKEITLQDYLRKANDSLYAIRNSKVFNKYLDNPQIDTTNIHEYFLTFAQSNYSVMQLRYIDKEGKEKIRIDRNKEGDNPFLVSSNNFKINQIDTIFLIQNQNL